MTVWRFNYRDKKYETKLSDIFEMPQAESIEVPDEWLSNVKTVSYTGYQGSGARSGSGAHMAALDAYMGYGAGKARGYGGSHLNARLAEMDEEAVKGRSKFSNAGEKEGRDQSKKAESPLRVVAGDEPETDSFRGDFWGFPGLHDVNERELTEAEERIANNALGIEESPAGASEEEEVDEDDFGLVDSIFCNDRFDELTVNHGQKVAFSFCGCSELMVELDGKEELLQELISDMAGLMNGPQRARALRAIYDILPDSERDKIHSNGF